MGVTEEQLVSEIISQAIVRLFTESLPRLLSSVGHVSDEQLWHSVNDNTNSIGNLVLHLTGNVNQWINTGLGGEMDHRERQSEFDKKETVDRSLLLANLEATMDSARKVLEHLNPEDLLRHYSVQGFNETGISIIMHVVEHFSYHVGQITYIVKSIKDIDTGYYSGKNLDHTN